MCDSDIMLILSPQNKENKNKKIKQLESTILNSDIKWFLDKDNIERQVCFKNSVNDRVVLVNILRIDLGIF